MENVENTVKKYVKIHNDTEVSLLVEKTLTSGLHHLENLE